MKKIKNKKYNYSPFCQILMNFGLFDPPRVKISTLTPLCFIIYYIIFKLIKYKKIKIQKNNCIPLLGVAPRV